MKALVTGGAGFIGSHLVKRLVERGDKVTVLDDFSRARESSLDFVSGKIKIVRKDVTESGLGKLVMGKGIVYHLASVSQVMESVRNPALCLNTNVMGTQAVVEACRKHGVGLVFTSSREVYGDAEHLHVRENMPLKPKNPYGISKVAGEFIISSYGLTHGLRYCILRLANVYGEGDFGRVLPIFIENCLKGEKLTVYSGEQVLDMLYISDAVDALIKAESLCGLCINIGSGKGRSVRELAENVKEATQSNSKISIEKPRKEEVKAFVADISLAREVLGWKPKMGFEEGLRGLIKYIRGGRIS